MKRFWLVIGWCVVFIGCNKVNTDGNLLNGNYIGYFHRNRQDTTQVSISFTENNYKGHSADSHYPALGKGLFEQKDNTIIFHDSCRWAGNIDRSLILKGKYNLQKNDDGTVRIWKEDAGTIDEYIFGRALQE